MSPATGQFNKATAKLREMIAASTTFLAEVAAAATEIVKNGGFDTADHWDCAGCVVENGKLDMTSIGGSPKPDASQFYDFVHEHTYRVSFEISDFQASTVVDADGAFKIGKYNAYLFDEDGLHEFDLKVTNATEINSFQFWSLMYDPVEYFCTYKVDNVSIKEILPAPVYLGAYVPETDGDVQRPFFVINRGGSDRVGFHNIPAGVLSWQFERAIPAAYVDDHEAAEIDFTNVLEAILDEVRTLSEAAGYLLIREITIDSLGRLVDSQDNAMDVFGAAGQVLWGLES